jgi:hypothetical protein
VLENTAVPLLLDVLEIFAGGTVRRILLAHVAQPPGKLREALAVATLPQPFHGEMFRLAEGRPGEDGDTWLEKNHRVRIGVLRIDQAI